MRRLALAIGLACVLSGMAHAGEIHTTVAVASPTPSPVTITGEIPATDGESTTVLAIILTLISIVS
jgi:hypothetical protein